MTTYVLRAACALFCFAMFLPAPSAAAPEQIYFDVDPTQSSLQATVTLTFSKVPGTVITLTGQGTQGLGQPGFSNGLTGQLDGLLAAKINLANNSVVFGGGSIYGLPSGNWEPNDSAATGIDPAFLGAMMTRIGVLPAKAVAAVRDFWIDYADEYSVTSLVSTGANQYSWNTNEWFPISTNVDLQGQTGLAVPLGADRLELREPYGMQNSNRTGQLTQTSPGHYNIRVPIDSTLPINAGEDDGLGTIGVTLRFQGQIVGTSVPIPPDMTLVESDLANHTMATAQPLDELFNKQFNPNIGNSIVNTSVILPHTTVHGVNAGGLEYFSFNVLELAAVGIFDIDGAAFDSQLFLYDSNGQLIASNDDAPYNNGGLGSLSSLDAYLEYNFTHTGRYTLAVGRVAAPGSPGMSAALTAGDYVLNISLTGAVPEPSSAALAGIGGLCAVVCGSIRRRAKKLACGPISLLALGLAIAGQPADASAASTLIKQSIEDVYDRDGTYPMPYRLFTPPDLGTPAELYPLVLFLHGAGERGNDNYNQVANHIDGLISATQSQAYESFLLAPQQTRFPLAGGWSANSPFDRTMEILTQVMEEYPIDPNRIYITGLSMGGYGTWDYIAKFPNLFAAAVPMSGGGSTSTASAIKDIPIWDFHGALDSTVSVTGSRNMINALIAAGGSPLYTELPNGEHNIWGPIYNDAQTHQYGLYDWMFSQSKANVSAEFVPEPSSLVLSLIGAGGLGLLVSRLRNRGADPERLTTQARPAQRN